jgi:hypothetical protein
MGNSVFKHSLYAVNRHSGLIGYAGTIAQTLHAEIVFQIGQDSASAMRANSYSNHQTLFSGRPRRNLQFINYAGRTLITTARVMAR